MVNKLPLVFIFELKLFFINTTHDNIKNKLDYLDLPIILKKEYGTSALIKREEYYFKKETECNNNFNVDICFKIEIFPTLFLKSDFNFIYGYVYSKILKFIKKRTFYIAKKISKKIKYFFLNNVYVNKNCTVKQCKIYELRNYNKNEIIIPLYEGN